MIGKQNSQMTRCLKIRSNISMSFMIYPLLYTVDMYVETRQKVLKVAISEAKDIDKESSLMRKVIDKESPY